jgi:hypothetical protein
MLETSVVKIFGLLKRKNLGLDIQIFIIEAKYEKITLCSPFFHVAQNITSHDGTSQNSLGLYIYVGRVAQSV